MPTPKKIAEVSELQQKLAESSIAIATNYSGQDVGDMTALRRALREKGVSYRIVKNTLLRIAADNAGRSELKQIIDGPTGLVFSSGEPSEAAKALVDYIKATRSTLQVVGGLMGSTTMTSAEVQHLAQLPSRSELLAKLLGQMLSPISSLVYVINAPLVGLVTVLQRKVENDNDITASVAVEADPKEHEISVGHDSHKVQSDEDKTDAEQSAAAVSANVGKSSKDKNSRTEEASSKLEQQVDESKATEEETDSVGK